MTDVPNAIASPGQMPEFINRTLAHIAAAALLSVFGFALGHFSNKPEANPTPIAERCYKSKDAPTWDISTRRSR